MNATKNSTYYIESDIQEVITSLSSKLDLMKGKTVMVTGAAGFLGRYFIALFQKYNLTHTDKPIEIIALDNHITSSPLQKGDARRLDPNIEWIFGDAQLGAALPTKVHYIIHTAGIASPEHYLANPLQTIDVAVNATRVLLEKALKDSARFLFFSSSEIYGDPDSNSIPTREEYRGNVSCRGPRACYDESKRLGETLCWIYNEYYGLHVNVVRPFNIYGPGMMPKDYRVMPNFAASMLRNHPLKVYGNGNQTRTFCYITDALEAFLLILVSGTNSNVYNVGNPTPEISMTDLAAIFTQLSPKSVEVEVIDYPSRYPKDDPSRRCPNIDKLKMEFDFTPKVGLQEGIKRFLRWTQKTYPAHL